MQKWSVVIIKVVGPTPGTPCCQARSILDLEAWYLTHLGVFMGQSLRPQDLMLSLRCLKDVLRLRRLLLSIHHRHLRKVHPCRRPLLLP